MTVSNNLKAVLLTSSAVAGYALAGSTGAIAPLAVLGLYKVIMQCNKPQKEPASLESRVVPAPSLPAPSSAPSSVSSVAPALSYKEARSRNIKVCDENGTFMRDRKYTSPSGNNVQIEMPKANDTLLIDPDYKGRISDYDRIDGKYRISAPRDPKIEVRNEDCLDVTLDLQKNGYRPILLNMANQTSMGGGYRTGARAQEEDICRRTTLYGALGTMKQPNRVFRGESVMQFRYKKGYNIPEFGCLASRNVQVFRDNQYELLENPEYIDVISSAAYNLGDQSVNDEAIRNPRDYEDRVKRKIRNILKTAILTGHDAIVLSAFGCGAFKNDPNVMAKYFKDVLDESTDISALRGRLYKDAIKAVFAIIGDHNDTRGNFQSFKREF